MVNEPSLELLQKGSSEAFQKLYEAYKHDFFLFARKFKVASSDITDIYQDTFITFYENLINGKVTEFSSSIKTYLFAIGKFKIYAYLKNKSKLSLITMNEIYEPVLLDMDLDTDELTERQGLLKKYFQQLGEQCQLILELFYLKGNTLQDIREIENYQNTDVVKSQKSRCLSKLRKLIKS